MSLASLRSFDRHSSRPDSLSISSACAPKAAPRLPPTPTMLPSWTSACQTVTVSIFSQKLRARGDTLPILVLTARDAVDDRLCGLDTGADDYLVKPFAIAELVARTKALLRRPGAALGIVLIAGNIRFDTVGRDVLVGPNYVQLHRRESAILEHLMRRLGRVVPKAVLEDKLYGIDEELESNAIPVHIHHLRRKLLDAGAEVEIHTVRGVGYLLTQKKTS
jgi:DNA-binding response OmpR family regulator